LTDAALVLAHHATIRRLASRARTACADCRVVAEPRLDRSDGVRSTARRQSTTSSSSSSPFRRRPESSSTSRQRGGGGGGVLETAAGGVAAGVLGRRDAVADRGRTVDDDRQPLPRTDPRRSPFFASLVCASAAVFASDVDRHAKQRMYYFHQ